VAPYLVSLLVTLAVLATPASATSGVSIELLAERAAGDDPRDSYYVTDVAVPGTTVTRHVRIGNGGADPAEVRVYVGAASVEGGTFRFDTAAADDLSAWASTSRAEVQVPPGGTADVAVEIDVPTAAPTGERYGVIWAEPAAPSGTATSIVNRVGVRIYLWIGEDPPASSFEIHRFRAGRDADGIPTVEVEVTNTGDRALDLDGSLEVDGLPAGSHVPLSGGTTLAPGQTAAVPAVLPVDVGGRPRQVTATVRGAGVEQQARAELAFPLEAGEQSAAVEARPVADPRPWPAVVVAAAAIVAALTAVVSAARPARQRPRETTP
jgi:hypothetical protein